MSILRILQFIVESSSCTKSGIVRFCQLKNDAGPLHIRATVENSAHMRWFDNSVNVEPCIDETFLELLSFGLGVNKIFLSKLFGF